MVFRRCVRSSFKREGKKLASGISYSKRAYHYIRKAFAYYSNNTSIEIIAEKVYLTEDKVKELLRYDLFIDSLELLTENNMDNSSFEGISVKSVHQQIFEKIFIEHIKEEFELLSFKEQGILGGFFGVCGETIEEIAYTHIMKENVVIKAKDRALKNIRKKCWEGKFGQWVEVNNIQ